MISALLAQQSRFGNTPVKFQVVCTQNGTAVLEGITVIKWGASDLSYPMCAMSTPKYLTVIKWEI